LGGIVFCINVLLTVKDEHADAVDDIRRLLAEACRLSREEPGCLRFEVYHSESDPKVFLLCERWQSEQAWKDHREEKAFREIYQPQVMPRVERVPHISTLVE
jgi:quinol monooxygenase YgiN